MQFDAILAPIPLNDIPRLARAAEAIGFKGLWVSETQHDPFLPGGLIAEHTQRMKFGTSVAIAFARSPATLAYTAWDLAQFSGGRFILGLGTQVKAHIQRRFGMQWPESPKNKLREQIAAIRAFWETWQTGSPLKFRGEYYRLSLMSPFFNPGPIDHPEIPIYIAGVNKGMASLAGEVADGFQVHPLHTPRYLEEVIFPALAGGARKSGRTLENVTISVQAFVATTPEEIAMTRAQVAFYASTPSYQPVMALHGWENQAQQLSSLASRGQWQDMPALIDDTMLETFAVIASHSELAVALHER
ncbi:MAG: TIGR03617 family F420-dependent LLM class oxidoreductase, partial [Anaerolineales bacterium]